MLRTVVSAAALAPLAATVAAVDYDVVVYGSSPAGIAAATAAGTLGLKVALFEPLKMIGGMGAAGNLALNDGGTAAEKTGLARNFTLLNGAAYGLEGHQVPHSDRKQNSLSPPHVTSTHSCILWLVDHLAGNTPRILCCRGFILQNAADCKC